jgi:hypothetical protein
MTAEISSLQQLRPKQIGFKDFRLGRSLVAEGKPAGIEKCSNIPDFSPEANKALRPATLESLRTRWAPLFHNDMACSASTTVLEKPAAVKFEVRGSQQTITGIAVEVSANDLPTISDLLSKSLGPPKDTTTTFTKEQLRAEIEKDEMKQCDQIRQSFANSATLADSETARCLGQVRGRVGLRMASIPVAGITQTIRTWTTDGVVVAYTSLDTQPTTKIEFYRTAVQEVYKKASAGLIKEVEDKELLAKQNEEAQKAKDF